MAWFRAEFCNPPATANAECTVPVSNDPNKELVGLWQAFGIPPVLLLLTTNPFFDGGTTGMVSIEFQ